MGSPDFAVPALDALMAAGHRIVCVYAQPPRPSGRGQKERPCPVHALAAEKGLVVRTPENLKGADEARAFAELGADAAVVAAYGLILPPAILAAPRLGCFNIHASLLPRWRGAAPIQRAILAGDTETGVTIMRMDEGLDTGPMLLSESVAITPETTAETLHDSLAEVGARLIVTALADPQALAPRPQPADGATYAPKLGRDEGRLDWSRPAAESERAVRALNPWPGIWFEYQGARVKVLAAEVAPGAPDAAPDAAPGTVLDDALSVACGTGTLRLTRVQREGRKPAAASAFLRGTPLPRGTVLG